MKPNTFAACRVHRIALRANDKELVDVETLRDAFAVRGRRASVADAIRRAVAAQAAAVRGEPNKPIVEPPLTWREKQEQRRSARARIA